MTKSLAHEISMRAVPVEVAGVQRAQVFIEISGPDSVALAKAALGEKSRGDVQNTPNGCLIFSLGPAKAVDVLQTATLMSAAQCAKGAKSE